MPEDTSIDDLKRVEERLRASGILDGLNEATAREATVIRDTYRSWARRLAPYFLRDASLDVATAIAMYRRDRTGPDD